MGPLVVIAVVTLLAEVECLLALVAASSGSAPHLFLLDELFRGTNAVERIAAGPIPPFTLETGSATKG